MPTGLSIGDVCIVIVGNDYTASADAQWDNSTLKPTGFTLIATNGNGTTSCHVAAFYRVIDGSESWPISVPARDSEDFWGFAIRVTGVDTANPLDGVGSALMQTTGATSHVIPGFNTTNNDCLAFYALSFDGGDGDPFSVSGTGWSESAEAEAGTGAGNCGGCWGTKSQPTAGATGDATVTSNVSDQSTARQWALRGAAAAANKVAIMMAHHA